MSEYVAKLFGESDGHFVSRKFGDLASAKAWIQRGGLAKFDDQSARGEVSFEWRHRLGKVESPDDPIKLKETKEWKAIGSLPV